MFFEAFPQLENNGVLRFLGEFFSSTAYMALVAFLSLVSALFSCELPVFYCYLALCVLCFFFSKDGVGFLPVVCLGYLSLSYANNPHFSPETSAFFNAAFSAQIFYCIGVGVLLIALRTVFTLAFSRGRGTPRLWLGFVLLTVSYLVGGAFSKYYGWGTTVYGFISAFSVCFLYFTMRYCVDFKKHGAGYIFRLLIIVGAVVLVQIVCAHFRKGVIENGVVVRSRLSMGWGHYNTAGCLMAMCACAPLYFAATQRHGWLFTALAAVYMVGVVLTQSRGAIFFGGVVFACAFVYSLVKASKRERIFSLAVAGMLLIAIAVFAACFFEKLRKAFHMMLEQGFGANDREKLFARAWAYFLSSPIFGVGWGGDSWREGFKVFDFFMAHNTVMQLLSCLGVVGAVCYAFHRFQTCVMFLRHRTIEKRFAALSILILLLTSMMDVHFFQCGLTALLYGALLAFMEGEDIKANADTRLRLKRL